MRNIYFVVPSKDYLPSQALRNRCSERDATIKTVVHTGRLADVEQLTTDESEKILAIDPDFCNWDLDSETLASIPRVQGLCLSTTSFDWAKPDIIRELRIPLINVPGFNTDSVAEYAVCMAIETARQLPMVMKNDWKPVGLTEPVLLKGKQAGVVGLGRLGTRVAELLKGIGMHVVYWSIRSVDDRFQKVGLRELFSGADLIIPALAVNDETRELVTHELIDQTKRTAIMIGVNRVRELWDEDYVIRKVESGDLGGYAYEGEDHGPLHTYTGNVWALPPIAWATRDSMENLGRIWIENIVSVLDGEPRNVVA